MNSKSDSKSGKTPLGKELLLKEINITISKFTMRELDSVYTFARMIKLMIDAKIKNDEATQKLLKKYGDMDMDIEWLRKMRVQDW